MTTRYVYEDAAPLQPAYQYVSAEPVYRYSESVPRPSRRVSEGTRATYVDASATLPARPRIAPSGSVTAAGPVMRPMKQLEPIDNRLRNRQRRPVIEYEIPPVIAPTPEVTYAYPPGYTSGNVVYEEIPQSDWYYHYPEATRLSYTELPPIQPAVAGYTTRPPATSSTVPRPPRTTTSAAKPPLAEQLKALPKWALYAGAAVGALVLLRILWMIIAAILALLQTEVICATNVQANECRSLGCQFDSKKGKCSLPLPAKVLAKAGPTRVLFVGNDPAEKTPCISNLLAAAGGSDSAATASSGSRYRRTTLKPLEIFQTPGFDVFAERSAPSAVKRMMAGLRLGENLQTDFIQWTPDRGNAIDRLVIVFDAADALVKGWFSTSVDAAVIDDWARFTERMDTGVLPPIVLLHTGGASKAQKVRAAMAQQFHRVPPGTSFDVDCSKVTQLDTAKLLHALTAESPSSRESSYRSSRRHHD